MCSQINANAATPTFGPRHHPIPLHNDVISFVDGSYRTVITLPPPSEIMGSSASLPMYIPAVSLCRSGRRFEPATIPTRGP